MENGNMLPLVKRSDSEANPVLNVLIVYEDFAAGTHAKRVYDRLSQCLGSEIHSICQMWKFDVLALPKLRAMAVCDAVEADVVIVSTHHANALPIEVWQWFDMWLAQECRTLALVALCHQSELGRSSAVRLELADVGRRSGLKFFSEPGPFAVEMPEPEFGTDEGRWRHETDLAELSQNLQLHARQSRWEASEQIEL